MKEIWTTVNVYSVQVGDRVQIRDAKGKPLLLAVRNMRNIAGGGKRLSLEDDSEYDLPKTGTLQAFKQAPR